MDSRAALGPIDPQVPGKDGRLVPLGALLVLVEEFERRAQEALQQGKTLRVTDRLILSEIDPKVLGNAYSVSQYVAELASDLLIKFKFSHWTHHTDGKPVTEEEREDRAKEIGKLLASHDQWKMHGHRISREVLKVEPLRLRIEDTETVPGLCEATRRLWAIVHWTFENGQFGKAMISGNFGFVRYKAEEQGAR